MPPVSPARPASIRSGAVVDQRIARAAGWDEGNRSMQRGGRTAWNEDDWNAACEVYGRLMRLAEAAPALLRQSSRPAKPRVRRAA